MKSTGFWGFARNAVVVAAVLLLGVGTLQATPLGLTGGTPDIMSGFQPVSYDATLDTLTIGGFALTFDGAPITGGTYLLSATIDDTGTLTGGTITIGGTVGAFMSGTLLTGSLTDFGFPNAGGSPFEFLFNVTGGDAAALFGPVGGSIISGTGFPMPADFSMNFSNGGSIGVSDTFGVPEPSTLLIFSLGLFAVVRRRHA